MATRGSRSSFSRQLKTPAVMWEWPRRPRGAPAPSFLPSLLPFPHDGLGGLRASAPVNRAAAPVASLRPARPRCPRASARPPVRPRAEKAALHGPGPALTRLSAPPSLFVEVTNPHGGVTSWEGPRGKGAGKRGGARSLVRSGWGCLAWRRGGLGGTLSLSTTA